MQALVMACWNIVIAWLVSISSYMSKMCWFISIRCGYVLDMEKCENSEIGHENSIYVILTIYRLYPHIAYTHMSFIHTSLSIVPAYQLFELLRFTWLIFLVYYLFVISRQDSSGLCYWVGSILLLTPWVRPSD